MLFLKNDKNIQKVIVRNGLNTTSENIKNVFCHMINGDEVDLSKAKNEEEKLQIIAYCKEPNKQSTGEKNQYKNLHQAFDKIDELGKNTIYLYNGLEKTPSEMPTPSIKNDRFYDCDARNIITSKSLLVKNFLITCKSVNDFGGAQTKQLDELFAIAKHAPFKNEFGPCLVIYIDGSFGTQMFGDREICNGRWEKGNPEKNRAELLKSWSVVFNKKIMVLTPYDINSIIVKTKLIDYYKEYEEQHKDWNDMIIDFYSKTK